MGNKTEKNRNGFKLERNNLRQSLPKLLCFKKHSKHLQTEYADRGDRESHGTDASRWKNEDLKDQRVDQKRASYHQDVEEALSSLLWQPYEYQNASRSVSSSIDLEHQPETDVVPSASSTSYTDLHLPTPSEMVNNLWRPAGQSPTVHASRDSVTISPSTAHGRLSRTLSSRTTVVECASCDDENASGMQVSAVPGSVPSGTASRASTLFQEGSLSSANVVGLPNHSRYASVPVSWAGGTALGLPAHARHISEPFDKQYQATQHSRSLSVPKSPHDGGTAATPRALPSQVNSDNVNVNFYRAVPVNVVSAVPTIRCLNSSNNGQGNDVSNVQVLPLGSSSFPTNAKTNFGVGTATNYPSTQPSRTAVVPESSRYSVPAGTSHMVVPEPSRYSLPAVSSTGASNITVPSPCRFSASCGTTNSSIIVSSPSRINVSCGTTPSSFTVTSPSRISVPGGTSGGTPGGTSSGTFVVPTSSRVNVSCGTADGTFVVPTSSGGTARTFTSTEAQTDDISVLPAADDSTSRRRRDRRERRQQRRGTVARRPSEGGTFLGNPRLPDLLNSHRPPPYATLPNGVPPMQAAMSPMVLPPPHGAVLQTVVPNNVVPPNGFVFPAPATVVPGHQVPMVQGGAPVAVPHPATTGFRLPFPVAGFSRGRFPEDHPKGCCGLLSWKPGSLRWFIALIALVAVCCVLVGTALGAMRPSGRDHLTVSLLMIGVGIVLVTVSGVAWRLTSHESSTCRSMLGLGGGSGGGASDSAVSSCTSRFVPRLPPSYGRPHHPYAAMMYPEFQYRPPPPSYQASMQEYRLRLLLLDRGGAEAAQARAGLEGAASPPPTYRSYSGSLLRVPLSGRRDGCQSEYSCPPSYRSQNSVNRQGTAQTNSALHSREHSTSLSISESEHAGSIVNIVNILGNSCDNGTLDTITLDSFKMEPDTDMNPVKMLLTSNTGDLENSKSGNLVTIVQSDDRTPVIVTVSGNSQIGSSNSVQITEIPSEIEILAHL